MDERELSCGASRGLGIRDAPRGCNQLVQCKEPQRQSKGKGTTEHIMDFSGGRKLVPMGPGSWSFLQGQKEFDGARVDSGYEIGSTAAAQLGSLQVFVSNKPSGPRKTSLF